MKELLIMVDISRDNIVTINKKIEYWKDQLHDMGRRNALLFFKETKTSAFRIAEPEVLEIFDRLVVDNKRIYAPLPKEDLKSQFELFTEEDDEGAVYSRKPDEFIATCSTKQLNRILHNLRYRSRLVREEQGYNALYLGFGLLRWQEGLGSEFSEAPLLLVPINVERESAVDRYHIELYEDDIVLNPTFITKLSSDFNINLEENPVDLSAEALEGFWEEVSRKVTDFDGWEVIKESVVGIFNFQTLALIKDLENYTRYYYRNPIINMLCGMLEGDFGNLDSFIISEELDEKVSPLDVFQILDADSSQQEAIEAAKQGASFVLQGPPGTGKSQTIANIIAEFMAVGKKILFVSQKSVALDIVYQRLLERGLSEFCLEVHSYKKNKKDVIQELGMSLSTIRNDVYKDTFEKKKELIRIRSELNNYVRELHVPRFNLKLSLFQVLGRLSKLSDSPDLRFNVPELQKVTQQDHNLRLLIIRGMIEYEDVIENHETYPWKGYKYENISIRDLEKIEEDFFEFHKIINEIYSFISGFALKVGLIHPENLADVFTVLNVLKFYKPTIFFPAFTGIRNRYINEYDESIKKIFRIQYWKDRSKLSLQQWQEKKLSFELIVKILQQQQASVNSNSQVDGDTETTHSNDAEITYEDMEKLDKLRCQFEELLKYVCSLFTPKELPLEISKIYTLPIDQINNWILTRANQTEKIRPWIEFSNLIKRGENNGLAEFIEKIIGSGIKLEQWEEAYKKRFYFLLSDLIIQSNQILRKFQSSNHNSLIRRFQELDKEIITLASLEIREKLYKDRPETTTWVTSDTAETIILKREMNKQRRIKPLRRLFSEIPNLIMDLKPCLMMSPLTVCQLLNPDTYHFDIAIFDEASQIPPEYAVSTIIRANQVIIAGDRHQLPPSRFFQALDSGGYDEEDYEIEDYESILNACDAINLPNKMLLWHYRSEDESLIAFSNLNFYDNKLLTFPNAARNNKSTGLEFIFVEDGIYRRGKGGRDNPIEARQVADLVVSSLKENPNLSVGVVAFSQSQRQSIEFEIEALRRDDPELNALFDYNKSEHVFVKNLETVQGDERDIIIFSIGYGRDELGNISMNFGPLNRQGGERRLNVAVTRARKAVKVVSSIEPEDFDLTRTQSRGVKLLKTYMKAARYGIDAIYEDESISSDAEFDSPFEESVYDRLSREGLILHKQVGVSKFRIDFGVVDPEKPGKYLLGIECDGAAYHSTPTARDRDRLRQQLLEDKFGWKIYRIWSRDWLNDPEKEVRKVIDAINLTSPSKKKLI